MAEQRITEPLDPSKPFLAVARIVAPQGIRGEVRCEVITDFPDRLRRTPILYAGEQHTVVTVEAARLEKRLAILKLAGVDSREAAERLRGQTLYVPESEAVALPAGTYFWHQIIGLSVRADDRDDLGVITEILQTGSNDVYIVRKADREILIPAIKDVVRSIDLDQRIMHIHIIEGLLD